MAKEHHRKAEQGQAIVEYGLIIVGISLAALLVLNLMGVSIKEVYCQIAGALGSQACSNLSCAFTFDDPGDLDGWVGGDVGKTLQIEDGYLCNTRTKYSFFSGCSEDMDHADFTVNLSGLNVTKTGNNHAGIDFMFRTNEMGDGYRIAYNTKKNWFTFWKRVNSKWVILERTSIPSEWGKQEMDFQLEADGNTFTVYQDGKPVIQTTDDTFTEGDFAWRNKPGSKSCIDEISFE